MGDVASFSAIHQVRSREFSDRRPSRAGSAWVIGLCLLALGTPALASESWIVAQIAALAVCAGVILVDRRSRSAVRSARWKSRNLEAVLASIGDAVVVCARDGSPLYSTAATERLFGERFESVRSRRLSERIERSDRPRLSEQIAEAVRAPGSPSEERYRGLRGDGSAFPLLCRANGARISGCAAAVLTLCDRSEDELVRRSVEAVVQRYEFFFSKMPLGGVIWDRDLRVQEWNESAAEIFGWSAGEAFGCTYRELVAEHASDAAERAVEDLRQRRGVGSQRCRNRTRDGRLVHTEWFHTSLVDEEGEIVAVASMVSDLTQRLALEERLRQSQKLEAMSAWTAGVAHEFNNLLTAILGNLELLGQYGALSESPAEWLAEAQAAAGRARDLTADLVRSHPAEPPRLEPIVLDRHLRDVADLFAYSLERPTKFEVEIDESLQPALADPAQVDRAVEHLLHNARNAVDERGTIRLRAANATLDEAFCAERDWARPGACVRIEVIDDGCGIDPAIQARIFEPFFTTKSVGRGSGLGLAVVRGIAKNHGGAIEVESEPGAGTRAVLYLRTPDGR